MQTITLSNNSILELDIINQFKALNNLENLSVITATRIKDKFKNITAEEEGILMISELQKTDEFYEYFFDILKKSKFNDSIITQEMLNDELFQECFKEISLILLQNLPSTKKKNLNLENTPTKI